MKSSRDILAFVNAKINEYSSAIKGFITIDDKKWVDLGLPSGRLWAAANERGFHQFDKAVKTFGDMLPSAEAWQELFDHCSRKWDWYRQGYVLTGPNGNTIFLPAKGRKYNNKYLEDVGNYGYYWSSSPYGVDDARCVYFNGGHVNPQDDISRLVGFSVRLAREFR